MKNKFILDNKIIIKFILQIISKYKYNLLVIFLFVDMLRASREFFIRPYLLKILGDAVQNNSLTLTMAIFIPILYAFFSCIGYFTKMTFEWQLNYNTYSKIEKDVRINLMNYIMQHSVNYFNNNMSGNITDKVNVVSELLTTFLKRLLRSIIIFVCLLVTIIIYININFYFALFMFLWMICLCFFQYFILKISYRIESEKNMENNTMSGLINDSITNILNIKSFSRQKLEIKKIKKQGIKILKTESKTANIVLFMDILTFVMDFVIFAYSFVFSFYLVMHKEIELGTFLFICQNTILMVSHIDVFFNEHFLTIITSFSKIKSCLNEILIPIDIKDKQDAQKLQYIKGKIVFKNLTFKYDN